MEIIGGSTQPNKPLDVGIVFFVFVPRINEICVVNYDLLMEQWLIWPVFRPANKTLAIRWVRHLGMDDKIPRAKTQDHVPEV